MRPVFALAALALLAACGGEGQLGPEAMVAGEAPEMPSLSEASSVELVGEAELARLVAEGDVILIDVRTPEEFAEGHIAGALNYPVEEFDPEAVPMEEGRETILYCRSARRSGRAAEMLAGHIGDSVRHLDGGIIAWQDAGREVVVPSE